MPLVDFVDGRGYITSIDPATITGVALADDEVLLVTKDTGSYILSYKKKETAKRMHKIVRDYIGGTNG
jgi:hypothetical protein